MGKDLGTMSNSPLVTRTDWAYSGNYTQGRPESLRGIVIHHACATTIDSVARTFQAPGRNGSAHYCICEDQISLMVDEGNTAWHCLPTDVTEVMTPDGFVPLSCLAVGDTVYQWDKDTGEITVGNVEKVISPRIETVFRMRDTEATAEHKIAYHTYDNPEIQVGKWGERLNTQTYFPDNFYYSGDGLDLTDDEIRFLVAVQADGSYIKNTESVSFHFRKDRKIGRLSQILENLGLPYRIYRQVTGTKIIVDNIVSFCEKYLEEKQFGYKLLDMNRKQIETFVSELPLWDGTLSDKTTFYCSSNELSAEVAQILIFLSGRQSNISERVQLGQKVNTRIALTKNNKYMFDKKTETTSRETEVSCVSVPTGFIVIRQYGRIQIIGNCSNWHGNCRTIGIEVCNTDLSTLNISDKSFDTLCRLVADIAKRNGFGKLEYLPDGDGTGITGHKDWVGANTDCPGKLYPRLAEIAKRANDINYPPRPTWVPMDNPKEMVTKDGAILYDLPSMNVVKEYHEPEVNMFLTKTTLNGEVFLRSEWSTDRDLDRGIKYTDLMEVPEPEPEPEPIPEPEPEPSDDTPNWFIRFIHALGEFFTHLFTRKK